MEMTNELWKELSKPAENIVAYIKSKLPKDWKLEHGEILSEVYKTFVELVSKYKESSMPLVSWCYLYGAKKTLTNLYAEYHRLKKLDTLYALDEIDDGDDSGVVKRYVTRGIAEEPKDLAKQLEMNDLVSVILEGANWLDRGIMCMIMDGYSYHEISKTVGMSKMAITKRMKKHAKRPELEHFH